jgi:hypothetical protein
LKRAWLAAVPPRPEHPDGRSLAAPRGPARLSAPAGAAAGAPARPRRRLPVPDARPPGRDGPEPFPCLTLPDHVSASCRAGSAAGGAARAKSACFHAKSVAPRPAVPPGLRRTPPPPDKPVPARTSLKTASPPLPVPVSPPAEAPPHKARDIPKSASPGETGDVLFQAEKPAALASDSLRS